MKIFLSSSSDTNYEKTNKSTRIVDRLASITYLVYLIDLMPKPLCGAHEGKYFVGVVELLWLSGLAPCSRSINCARHLKNIFFYFFQTFFFTFRNILLNLWFNIPLFYLRVRVAWWPASPSRAGCRTWPLYSGGEC